MPHLFHRSYFNHPQNCVTSINYEGSSSSSSSPSLRPPLLQGLKSSLLLLHSHFLMISLQPCITFICKELQMLQVVTVHSVQVN